MTPSEEALSILERCIGELASQNKRLPIRWLDKTLLHSTVLFLGEVEERLIPFITEALDDVVSSFPVFYLDITVPEILFKNKRPKIIYMKLLDQSGIYNEIYKKLFKRLKGVMYIEKTAFMPHITLGRVKGSIPKNKKIILKTSHIDSLFCVKSIELTKSTLTSIGPLYSTLHSTEASHG